MSTPFYTLVVLGLFVTAALVLIVTGHGDDQNGALLIGLILSTLPSLVASLFAERVSRDVRNGVLVGKVQEGAQAALDETGVTEVVEMSQRGETSILAMQALTRLLEQTKTATEENTAAHTQEGDKA